MVLNVDSALDAGILYIPGRLQKPNLVSPSEVPRRAINTDQGRTSLLHSLAHIEFNATILPLPLWELLAIAEIDTTNRNTVPYSFRHY